MRPAISFLVCTRNRCEIAKSCVINLLKSTRNDIEVIVRDNCSTDTTFNTISAINDNRLTVVRAPENQGTRNFFEISKLATGKIVTWISDEDDFVFEELDSILERFENPDCSVLLGGIVVGPSRSKIVYKDEIVHNRVESELSVVKFSGCGGVFIRTSCLREANTHKINNDDDAYMAWNYYPVGFFAHCCLMGSLFTISKIVVKQARFGKTNNNWSLDKNSRLPHYYPESIYDRLICSLIRVFKKDLDFLVKVKLSVALVKNFYFQTKSFLNPDFLKLLEENYGHEITKKYRSHIEHLKLVTYPHQVIYNILRTHILIPVFFINLIKWRRIDAK